MDKKEAGRLGGLKTVERYGREHMRKIGRLGYLAIKERYRIEPNGTSGWRMVRRKDNKVIKEWT